MRAQAERVRRAVEELPMDFREVIVLRELEGLSYQEIATVVDIPIGTVMSRLSRALDAYIDDELSEQEATPVRAHVRSMCAHRISTRSSQATPAR